ncbi:hypothetical protein SFUMM280S_01361 [Streptomyces fumanus]
MPGAVTRQAHAVLVRGALLRDDPEAARAHQARAQRAGLTRFSDGTTLLVRHGRALLAAYTDEPGTAKPVRPGRGRGDGVGPSDSTARCWPWTTAGGCAADDRRGGPHPPARRL